MKIYILVLCFFALSISNSQSQILASEGKMEYRKGSKPAAVIELPYPPEIVEDAIKEYLAQKGVKQDKSKGFQIFRGARIYESSNDLNDLHFKVERKSRQDKNSSVVYLIPGKLGEDISLRTSDDRNQIDAGINFLNNMVPSVEAYNLNVDIGKQEETIKKAEKKLKNLEEDQEDMEKRIKNLQEKLEENKINQKKQAEEITKQKIEYEGLKSRKRI